MSLPIWALLPVSGASMPILKAPPCARATAAPSSDTDGAAAAARAVVRRKRRRVWFIRLSLGSAGSAPERAENASRREQDDADVHGAQDEEPPLGIDAHEVLEEHDHRRADHGTGEGARPAERDHQQRLHGRDEL